MIVAETLRAAVVGTGFIGPHHIDAVRRGGYGEVAVLVDRDPDRGPRTARALGVPRAVTDLDAVLEDPRIDIVHICTPNRTHVEMARSAMEAGKHVVIEKPVAIDRAGAESLLEVAARTKRHAAVALTYRGYPMVGRARDLVRSGRLGHLRLVHGGYLQDWLSDATDYNWRLDPAVGGLSRAVADIGTHWFDTAEFVTGARVRSVMADLATLVPVRHKPVRSGSAFSTGSGATEPVVIHTEDAATILVRFDEGAIGALVVSQVSPGHKNDLTVHVSGTDQSLGWAQEDPERLWLGARTEAVVVTRDPLADPWPLGVPSLPAGHPEGWDEALRDVLRPFYAAIAAGEDPAAYVAPAPYPTLTDGARSVALIEAVVESARSGRWVDVVPIDSAKGSGIGEAGVTGEGIGP
ncbi:MAG TPA: Gfo/Idh/MocA family oxidoreductase [Candidatus Limnocylindrales bacterium]|nr:Gfo/Idh/MocA family oxidoreductase [Candidatus Limnocylindrales bacterium]